VVAFVFLPKSKKLRFDINKFDIERITRGKVEKIVTATGTINPVNIISVGSQISGKIERVYVDYNDAVKKNQRLAKLETDVLEKQLREYGSYLKQQQANLKFVELNTKRVRELYKNKYIAKSELDQAETNLVNAREEYNIAKTKYERGKTELGYAYIISPVSGIVISRDIDEGQTVAASFSAPTLFKIAEDLKRMQIETSISESDIGLVKNNENLDVKFTVDAYKNKEFAGKIKQIRLDPAVESNVVMYNVIIEINNEDSLLLPGMTAYVSIIIESAKDVLRVPNTALRFKSSKEARNAMGLEEMTRLEKDTVAAKMKSGNFAYIYVVGNGNKPRGIVVEKGIADMDYTEIKSNEINEGDAILASFLGKIKEKK
jgi:HlyD family secretion protein